MIKAHTYIIVAAALLMLGSCRCDMGDGVQTDATPAIFPDYTDVTVPPNIAPLNFRLAAKEGDACRVPKCRAQAVFTAGDFSTSVGTRNGKFIIPRGKWRRILATAQAADGRVEVSVTAETGEGVVRYKPFNIVVAPEKVDPYIAYRLIEPGYETWGEMGIYQRSLETFRQSPVIENASADYGCLNCHSFCNRDPERMLFHMRQQHTGTLITQGHNIEKLNTATKQTLSPLVYPSWHPSGRYVAFSTNKTRLITLPSDRNRVEVFDSASDVVVYDVEHHQIISSPRLAASDSFETFPTFSADGRTLYFCSADSVSMPDEYKSAKYSLCAVSFDPDTGSFGSQTDTLYNARTLGRSVSFPRVSPDGRFMLYALADYGNFSIWHRDADLQMIDLATNQSVPIDAVNSPEAESYHSWSGNSRWILFNSRRVNGLYTHAFIAYVAQDGTVSKPFILPQRDPDFYATFMKSYNIPEFIEGRIRTRPQELISHARNDEGIDVGFAMRD